MDISRYLEDIEARLDGASEEAVEAAYLAWARHENTGDACFAPPARPARPSKLAWPQITVNQAFADDDLMVLSQFYNVHRALASGSASPLYVRANYGVGNVATMFGARLFMMEDAMNTLPNVYALDRGLLREYTEGRQPDMMQGNGEKIWRMAERFAEIREKYPAIARFVRLEQPDLQGPMDNCELLWGSDIFYAFYDEPEAIHTLLNTVTDFIDAIITRWHGLFPRDDHTCSYFQHIETGGIAIRDDSAMNLPPEFFRQFIAPYDGRLLAKYGGIVHFCGRGDHYIDQLTALPGLHGINMSQPHLNDMETILSATVDKNINLSVPTITVGNHTHARILMQ